MCLFLRVFNHVSKGGLYDSVCLCIHLRGCTGVLDEYLEQRSASDSVCTVWARIQPGQPSGDQSRSDYDVTATDLGAPRKLGEVNKPQRTAAVTFR